MHIYRYFHAYYCVYRWWAHQRWEAQWIWWAHKRQKVQQVLWVLQRWLVQQIWLALQQVWLALQQIWLVGSTDFVGSSTMIWSPAAEEWIFCTKLLSSIFVLFNILKRDSLSISNDESIKNINIAKIAKQKSKKKSEMGHFWP